MKIHELKTEPAHFDAILNDTKTAELRINDRNFQVGDFLNLRKFEDGNFIGFGLLVKITHILSDEKYLQKGFVMLSFKNPTNNELLKIQEII